MHTPESAKRSGTVRGAIPARRTPVKAPGRDSIAGHPVLALQSTAGNAAVVQLLRRSDRSWAQEQHQHGADSGPRQPASDRFEREAEDSTTRSMAGSAPVQRAEHGDGPSDQAVGETPVQRYTVIAPGAAGYPRKRATVDGVEQDASADEKFFLRQEKYKRPRTEREKQARPAEGDYEGLFANTEKGKTQANLVYEGSVPLAMSASQDMAIEHGDGREAKSFFSTQAVIAAANQELQKKKSYYQLHPTGKHLVVPRANRGEKKLLQVTARRQKSNQAAQIGEEVRVPQACNDMAYEITRIDGLSGDANVRWDDHVARALDAFDGKRAMGLGKYADKIKGRSRVDRVHEMRNPKTKDKSAGEIQKDYLTYVGELGAEFKKFVAKDPDRMERILKKHGVGKHMPVPRVGNAIETIGNGDAEEEAERTRNPQKYTPYHFGAVVAVSGKDYITLESKFRNDPEVGRETVARDDPLWYFSMHGTAEGQTWHDTRLKYENYIGTILSITVV